MAKAESDIVHEIMVATSPLGIRLFKNVRGSFYTLDCVKRLITAIKEFSFTDARGSLAKIGEAVRQLRIVAAGLQAAGSSDLIGFVPVTITEAMVGKRIAVFAAVEVKTLTGRVDPEQQHFVDFVKKNGGLSGVARSKDDASRICTFSLDGVQQLH